MINELKGEGLIGKVFVGTVKYNADPSRISRVKVMVPELFDGYSVDDLPWMTVARPVFRGASANVGWHCVPRVGSQVLCTFDKGNINSGIVTHELVTANTQPTDLLDEYPDTWGWIDENGTKLEVNAASKILTLHHRGTTVVIDASGNVNVHVVGNLTGQVDGTMSWHSNGAASISSDVVLNGTAPVINLTGNTNIVGNITTTGPGGSPGTVSMSGDVTVNSGKIETTGGTVIDQGIVLKTHKHGGVTAGGAQTSTPV